MKLLDVIRNPKYSKRLREVIGTFRQYNLDEWFGDIPLQSFRDMCIFRLNRPPIPLYSGRLFRSIPAT